MSSFEMEDSDLATNFMTDDWFSVCKEKFKGLSSSEKSSVILNLIDLCDAAARFNLLQACSSALHCDILPSVPQIALDKILEQLSVPDILNACKVSHKWNKCISQSEFVWKKKWLEMGTGSRDQKEFLKRDWKLDCIAAQGLYFEIERRQALDYDLDLCSDYNHGYISAMDYCNGKLVLCHNSGKGGSVFSETSHLWLCSFSLTEHGHPTSVRLLPSNLLVAGSNSGKITIWRFLEPTPGSIQHEVRLLHVCHGHSSIVLSVDGCEEEGVAVSGSRDARIKVWSLLNGNCLKTFDFSSPVLQVSFYSGDNSLMKEYNFMLIHCSEKIFLKSWKRTSNWLKDDVHTECIVSAANILPGIHVKSGTLYYCSVTTVDGLQHTDFNSKHLNLPAVIGKRNESLSLEERVHSFPGIFRKLMQVGTVFAMLIADDNIMAINIKNGRTLFKEYLPYSAATSPALPQITVGDGKWLDGLLHVKRLGMILALAIYNRNVTFISWASSFPVISFKGD